MTYFISSEETAPLLSEVPHLSTSSCFFITAMLYKFGDFTMLKNNILRQQKRNFYFLFNLESNMICKKYFGSLRTIKAMWLIRYCRVRCGARNSNLELGNHLKYFWIQHAKPWKPMSKWPAVISSGVILIRPTNKRTGLMKS